MGQTDLRSATQSNGGGATDTASQGRARDDTAGQSVGAQVQGKADEVRQKAGEVKETAAEEVQNIVGTAKQEARGVLGDLGRTVDQEANDQTVKIAQLIDSVSGEFEELASKDSGFLSMIAKEAAPKTRDLARWMEQTSPREMVSSVEDFARRQPMLFILGCAAAGVVAGRLTRGLIAGEDGSDTGTDRYAQSGPASQSLTSRQSYPYSQPAAGTLGSGSDGPGTWGTGPELTDAGEPMTTVPGSVPGPRASAAPLIASELQADEVAESGLTTGIRPGEAGLDLDASEPRSEQRPQTDRPEGF